jgi:hypothetical protein
MSVKPFRKLEILQRRQKVTEMLLQGTSQSAIAQQLGVTQSLVSRDLKKIQTAWRQSSIRNFDEIRTLELEKLAYVEQEAWGAWKRSQQPAQTATVDGQAGTSKAKRTVRHQYGDPRFLEIVLHCNEAKRQMLGLDAPTKIAPTTPDGRPLTIQERRIHIQAILAEIHGDAAISISPPQEKMPDVRETTCPGADRVAAGEHDGPGIDPPEPACLSRDEDSAPPTG